MNTLISILFAFSCIIVLLLIIGLFLKKDFYNENSTIITTSKAEVFNYLKFLNHTTQYNKWAMQDPGNY